VRNVAHRSANSSIRKAWRFQGNAAATKYAGVRRIGVATRDLLFGSGLFCSRRRGRDRRKGRIGPAGTDAIVEHFGRFLVFLLDVALPHDASEADLDVLARAAEPIVEVEMPESGVEVVTPHQAHGAFAEPPALVASSRARQDDIVGAAGSVLGGVAFASLGRLGVCVLGLDCAGRERCRADKNRKGTPNNTDHDRTIGFRSGPTGTGNCAQEIGSLLGLIAARSRLSSMAELAGFVQRRTADWINAGRASEASPQLTFGRSPRQCGA
jgi:hypothetical protein